MLRKKFVIFLIGFYIFWLGVLPFILNNTVECFCTFFSKKTPYTVEVKKPKFAFSIIPIVQFKADEISLSSDNDVNAINLNKVEARLRILPLLSGKIHINSFKANNVNTSLSLSKAIELDKDFIAKIKKSKMVCDSIYIENFETRLTQKDIKKPIRHYGTKLLFQKKNRYIKFQMNSFLDVGDSHSNSNWNLFLPKNNDINKTIFDIHLSNFDISNLKTYLKNYLPQDLVELKGKININANKDKLITELVNCAAIMKDSAQSIILPKKIILASNFNINKQCIYFNSIDIDSDGIHSELDGRIYNYLGKSMPIVDINIRVNKSKIEDIINMLPPFKIEELDAYKLKKYKFYGDLFANIKIKGRLPEPNINGDVYITNGILTKPIPNTSKGASIKIDLLGKNAEFKVLVPVGRGEQVLVEGSQEIYNIKYADLNVTSSENIDLKSAQDVLNPLHEILNFIIGPVPIMELQGLGNIDINVKGNRKNPHVRGIMNIKNSSARFNELSDFVINNTDAIITFNDQNVLFSTKKSLLNGKDIKINGTCNLFGKFDFDLSSQDQSTAKLYEGIRTGKLISELTKNIPQVQNISGKTDFNLKVYGTVKSLQEIIVNKNVFAKGEIKLKDNDFTIQNVIINNTNGYINFDNQNAEANINAKTGGLPLDIKTSIRKNNANIILNIPKLNPNFIFEDLALRSKQYLPYVSVNAKYKGKIDEIEFDKLNLYAKVLNPVEGSEIKFETGEFSILNNKININNFSGHIGNVRNTVQLNLKASDAFSKTPNFTGNISIKTPDLTLINEVLASDIFPAKVNAYLKDFRFSKGAANLSLKIVNNRFDFITDLTGIKILYLPLNLPVEFINGTLSLKHNTLRLNKINLLADNMPVLIDGDIKEVFDKQICNLYINSKPKQDFIDKYFNKNQIYPLKVKGDIVYWAKIKGVPDKIDLLTKIDLSKGASIYHLGATIGDIENAITVYQDAEIIKKNNVRIKEFSYDKIIDSLNGKQTKLNLLKAWGGLIFNQEDLVFDDFHIKTSNPTDARIFNIIFRKPNIKEGLFTSNLKFNGKLSNPKLIGDFHIFETEIPFFDTTAKNIELTFKDKTIELFSKGDILGNDFRLDAVLKNKTSKPYIIENGKLYTKNLDLNRIINKLKISEIDNVSTFESFEDFELSSIIFNDFRLIADSIELRNIQANDFEARIKLDEKGLFDVDDFKFNIAQGILKGNYQHNLKNNDIILNFDVDSIDANDITYAVFDLENQIYGDMTGTINLSCNGTNYQSCMQTLNGNSIFNVKNGRMPKLGSLEYLLKAANLVKSGFTSLSINSIIDIITPLKTGEFSDIYGAVRIKDGIARNFEATSKGKNLSLYIAGTYNFSTSIADMQVFGLLSKKLSTLFGPIGNLSVNTLFNIIPGVDLSKDNSVLEKINKIPGIELSSKAYRKFIANVKGNLNGDNYVTSFQWIN